MNRPTTQQIEKELNNEIYKKKYKNTFLSTIYGLITVAAIAVLIATLFLPVLEIHGSSMSPTLEEKQIVVALKNTEIEAGDIVSFYYNNKILVKRAIAFAGDWVDIDEKGNIYVNEVLLDEPYLKEKALGECDLKLPYQVPEGRVFVCGDHRSTSVDSRSSIIGCVSDEQIVGVIKFRVWPIAKFGPLS